LRFQFLVISFFVSRFNVLCLSWWLRLSMLMFYVHASVSSFMSKVMCFFFCSVTSHSAFHFHIHCSLVTCDVILRYCLLSSSV
jgi:hypothetical protein